MVGPLLSSPAKPLPHDLEEFVSGSGDKGVIIVSFGSILGKLDDKIVTTMAAVFSSLPQRVIWKLKAGTQDLTLQRLHSDPSSLLSPEGQI